jgi:pimeloyl-ACP methyl ester carboxylesterase
MRTLLTGWILLALAGQANVAPAEGRCDSPDNETRVRGDKECLVIGCAADYIYERAREAVTDGRVVVALLRPGYFDSSGNQSSGDNFKRQDSYTKHNIDAIAAALKALRGHHKASHLILVGHSGGAAISGVILGRHPGVADAAVLAACPCFIAEWRAGRRRWMQSLSPDEVIKQVPVATRVVALTGDADDNTRPILARDYVEALAKRGKPARFELARTALRGGE